jgi:hypothetical protein
VNTYAILRRKGWRTPETLEAAALRSRQVGDIDLPNDVSWIRSYVLVEEDGTLGTVCIYQASDPQAIYAHAGIAGLPADEILPVADAVVLHPDPMPTTAERRAP